jgi:hypothetical protein
VCPNCSLSSSNYRPDCLGFQVPRHATHMKLSYRHSMSGISWLWSISTTPVPPTAAATAMAINGGLQRQDTTQQTPVTSIPMNVYCLSIYYKFNRAPGNLCALSKKQAFGRLGRRSGLSIPPRQVPPLSERLNHLAFDCHQS